MNANSIEIQEDNPIKLLRAKEVSEMLGISLSFTYKLMETGILKYVRIGTAVRIRLQDIVEYIDSHLIQPSRLG